MTTKRLIATSALALALAAPHVSTANAACTSPASTSATQTTAASPAGSSSTANDRTKVPGSPERVVERMVDNPVVASDGTKHAEGGPAKPRESWMTPCPQGEEPNRDGKCVKADVKQEVAEAGEQKVISGTRDTSVTIDGERLAAAPSSTCN